MENNWTPVSFSDAVNLNPTVKLTKGEEYPFVDMKSVDPAWREVSFSELRAFKSGGAKFLPKDTLNVFLKSLKILMAVWVSLHGKLKP